MYNSCEKYHKPFTVQYYIANCVSWVSRLTLWDLNKLDLTNRLLERNLFICGGLTVWRLGNVCLEVRSTEVLIAYQPLLGRGWFPPALPQSHQSHVACSTGRRPPALHEDVRRPHSLICMACDENDASYSCLENSVGVRDVESGHIHGLWIPLTIWKALSFKVGPDDKHGLGKVSLEPFSPLSSLSLVKRMVLNVYLRGRCVEVWHTIIQDQCICKS